MVFPRKYITETNLPTAITGEIIINDDPFYQNYFQNENSYYFMANNMQQINLLLQPSDPDSQKNYSDYIYKLDIPMNIPSGSKVFLGSINVNGDRSCFIIPKKLVMTTLVNGATVATVTIESKIWEVEDLIKKITGEGSTPTGISIMDGYERFIASDVSKSLTIQFQLSDWQLLSSLLGLEGQSEWSGAASYNIPADGKFPRNFMMNLFTSAQISLGFAGDLPSQPGPCDLSLVPLQVKIREAFQIGNGFNNPLSLPSFGNEWLCQLSQSLSKISFVRMRISTPDNDLLPHFLFKISFSLCFIW